MKGGSAVGGFTLHDLTTRVVPGLAAMTPTLIGAILVYPGLLPLNSFVVLMVGLLAYLIGEFFNLLRSGLLRVPMNFRYFVYRETGSLNKMPWHFQKLTSIQSKLPTWFNFYVDIDEKERLTNDLDLDFREDMEEQLGIDFNENRPREVYDSLMIYMDPILTSRTRRFQSLSIFAINLQVSVVFVTAIYGLVFLTDVSNFARLIPLLVSLALLVITIVCRPILAVPQYHYIELLVKEYYMKRHRELRIEV